MPSPPIYPVEAFIRGTTAFLIKQIDNSLAQMNQDVVNSIVSSSAPPAFTSQIGDVPSVSESRICVCYKQFSCDRIASEGSRELSFTFEIKCLIPTISDNTTMQFEMARQIAAEWTLHWLLDDDISLRPWVTIGSIADPSGLVDGNNKLRAKESAIGPNVDVYGLLMPDGKTRPRGWSQMYTVKFSIRQVSS